jgi:uncharacterized protein
MAQFEILTNDGDKYLYESDGCLLTDARGNLVDLSKFKFEYVDGKVEFVDQIPFTPENPVVGKSTAPKVLKIQLGLGCNYSCSYCSQGGQKEEKTSSLDAENLDLSWVTEAPEKVELWGGEPLLYWKKIQTIVPIVASLWPDVRFSIVTNGSLLDDDKIDWLVANNFSMAISHDGPGQHIRGADPFEDPEWVAVVRRAFVKFNGRIAFNTVLTGDNFDLFAIIMWFESRMGHEVRVNVEDIVTDYGGGKLTDNQLERMYKSIKGHCESGLALVVERIRWSTIQFLSTLAIKKPLAGSNQVCQMDRPDYVAVDLKGNVLTCQNAGVESGHKIGTTADIGAASLTTSTSYMARPNCAQCPVVHLCYGSCMFLKDQDFESSCRSAYWYNRAILEGLFKQLTGKTVVDISGWKPTPAKRIIPLKVTV